MFIAVLLIINKTWKQSKCPAGGEYINVMHADNGALLSNKKK
jgi:hypothetical protein